MSGWHSRGYLPHLDVPGLVQSITIRLADSLPKGTLQRLLAETEHDDQSRRQRLDALLDAGHGACWLGRGKIAALVEQALLDGDGQRYRLLSWVIMPNHVHILIETMPGISLGEVVRL